MNLIPFVTEEQSKIARDVETSLLGLEGSGILFVGVQVLPQQADVPSYVITVGCERSMDEGAVGKLVELVVAKQFPIIHKRLVIVRRGCVRSHAGS